MIELIIFLVAIFYGWPLIVIALLLLAKYIWTIFGVLMLLAAYNWYAAREERKRR